MSLGYLRKMSIQVLCPFLKSDCFFGVELCKSLHILDINHLLAISFANTFSYSVGCLFVLLMVSFAVRKILFWCSLNSSFLLLFISLARGDISRKMLPGLKSKKLLRLFSSSSFVVSGLIFKSLINFKFIFVYIVRKWSFAWSYPVCPTFLMTLFPIAHSCLL